MYQQHQFISFPAGADKYIENIRKKQDRKASADAAEGKFIRFSDKANHYMAKQKQSQSTTKDHQFITIGPGPKTTFGAKIKQFFGI